MKLKDFDLAEGQSKYRHQLKYVYGAIRVWCEAGGG